MIAVRILAGIVIGAAASAAAFAFLGLVATTVFGPGFDCWPNCGEVRPLVWVGIGVVAAGGGFALGRAIIRR